MKQMTKEEKRLWQRLNKIQEKLKQADHEEKFYYPQQIQFLKNWKKGLKKEEKELEKELKQLINKRKE